MNGHLSLLIAAFYPIIAAPVVWAMGRKDGQKAIMGMVGATAVEMANRLVDIADEGYPVIMRALWASPGSGTGV